MGCCEAARGAGSGKFLASRPGHPASEFGASRTHAADGLSNGALEPRPESSRFTCCPGADKIPASVTRKTSASKGATGSSLYQERVLVSVYVSSTYSDLRDHRAAVYKALRQLGHDVAAMEDYVASDQRPLDRCLADVASRDLYIGIIAWRYGYVPEQGNPEGRSITELEYREARRRGIPCLLFLLDEDAPWPRSLIDTEPGASRIEALRAELARERLVSYFRTTEDLARSVAIAVSNQIASGGPGRSQPASEDAGGIRMLIVSSSSDGRLVHQLVEHLTSLQREGLVSALSDCPIDNEPGSMNGEWADLLRHADIVLLLLSTDLLATGYVESKEFQWLLERHAARLPQLIPVLLRPVAWSALPWSLRQIPPLPGPDRSVAQSRSLEVSFVEVAEGVRLACLEIMARRRRPPAETQRPRPVRAHYRLVEVFKESGVPSVTFVEPDDFYQLKLALEQPGRGVVIEGPSGVGKTTALQTAVKQLDGGTRERFKMLSARNGEHVASIAKLRAWHRGPVAIDDFHRLAPKLRAELVDYLKVLADTEPVDRKLVIVGIPG